MKNTIYSGARQKSYMVYEMVNLHLLYFKCLSHPVAYLKEKRNLRKIYNPAFCDIHAEVEFKLAFSATARGYLCMIRKYSGPLWMYNITACRDLWGPPFVPLKHLNTQQDMSDDRRSRNVKRRIGGEVLAKRRGRVWTLGILVWVGIRGEGQRGQNQWVPV